MAEQTWRLIIVLPVLGLAGCATGGGAIRAGDVAEPPTASAAPPPEQSTTVDPVASGRVRQPGAVALEAEADRARSDGDLARAAATLERALRIDAGDPELWLALAEVRLGQGQNQQAVELARRAASLAQRESAVYRRARDLQHAATLSPGPGR